MQYKLSQRLNWIINSWIFVWNFTYRFNKGVVVVVFNNKGLCLGRFSFNIVSLIVQFSLFLFCFSLRCWSEPKYVFLTSLGFFTLSPWPSPGHVAACSSCVWPPCQFNSHSMTFFLLLSIVFLKVAAEVTAWVPCFFLHKLI